MDFKGFRAGNEHSAPAMENDENRVKTADPFLLPYQPSELRIASEFLATWLPFLSRDLCHTCTQALSDRVKSLARGLDKGGVESEPLDFELDDNGACSTCSSPNIAESQNISDNCDTNSLGSWKDAAEHNSPRSLKDELNGPTEAGPGASTSADLTSESPLVQTPIQRISWADMAQEDELEDDDDQHESNERIPETTVSKGDLRSSNTLEKPNLSREQREYIRFINVKRTKDFICLEKINGKIFNILAGLELHAGVFSAAEQKRIVDYVHVLQEQGSKGELKERTYSAPQKWMRGKGRVTIQFGCCYNYAKDKYGNPPGILQNEMVDPIPPLLKVIIRRLIRWHILPPTCVPDSCIVNIYEEGDCIPPHIDNHDFVRPFCTVSFLSECNIVFGSNLKVVGAGEFTGSIAIPLPVGSVLVLNGNAADVAKHCVPAVPTKRISITFRRMDDSKRPVGFLPEPDLQGIEPLSYDRDKIKMLNCPISDYPIRRQPRRVGNSKARERDYSEPQYSTRSQRGPANKHKIRPSMGRGN